MNKVGCVDTVSEVRKTWMCVRIYNPHDEDGPGYWHKSDHRMVVGINTIVMQIKHTLPSQK